MAFTQTDLDQLDAQIATGVLRVKYADGREVHYQTTADMVAARDRISSLLQAKTRQRRVAVAEF
jgi:hypothetical protein